MPAGPIDAPRIARYFAVLGSAPERTVATDAGGARCDLEQAMGRILETVRARCGAGGKIVFVGNGGSAAIASHMAIDYGKNGGFAALALNDGAALTCLANDLGYDRVFARQIEMLGKPGDVVVAISSSGASANILEAVAAARAAGAWVLTLSGFSSANPLRRLGDLNLHVAADRYGPVELSHLALLHAVLDMAMDVDDTCPEGRHPERESVETLGDMA